MARLFGFSIDPKKKDSPSVISPVPQNNEDGNDNFIASSFYGSYVDIEGVYRSEFDLIKKVFWSLLIVICFLFILVNIFFVF